MSFSCVLPVFVHMIMVLFRFWSLLFLFLSGRCCLGCLLWRLLWVPLPIFSRGVALLGLTLSSLLYFLIIRGLRSGYFVRSILRAGAVVLSYCCIVLLCLFSFSWRRASGKFPSPPAILQLQFFSAAIGHCAWRLQLSPLVRCVHGDSIVCPLPYRLL